jgi:hypothetical protein
VSAENRPVWVKESPFSGRRDRVRCRKPLRDPFMGSRVSQMERRSLIGLIDCLGPLIESA